MSKIDLLTDEDFNELESLSPKHKSIIRRQEQESKKNRLVSQLRKQYEKK